VDADGRASHVTGIGTFSTAPALTLAPSVDSFGMASTSARTSTLAVLSDVRVLTITRENSHTIFGKIKQALLQRRGRVFISIDLKYAASSKIDLRSQPHHFTQWYLGLNDLVNAGDALQLGIVFAFDGQCLEPVKAYEINIQFDAASNSYSYESLAFWVENGHVLEGYGHVWFTPRATAPITGEQKKFVAGLAAFVPPTRGHNL
jgi:hypothetical protein